MAEVSQGSGNNGSHSRKPRQKKKSTKVDMTAMVDVAFLLLTFFILTTTLLSPMAMQISKPPDEGPNTQEVAASKVMTFILGEEDQIYYYTGATNPKMEQTDYSEKGIREVIMGHLNKNSPRCGSGGAGESCWDPIFVIKPNRTATFQNMVDMMDEMFITGAPKYALADVTTADSVFLAENGWK